MIRRRRRLSALLLSLCLVLAGMISSTAPATARGSAVTNLDHLDFLLDEVALDPVPGHTTYRLRSDPKVLMPWTYADVQADGSYRRVGGGTYDPTTGDYGQGAFNADDITRAAVVYLRHWQQTRSPASRAKAYDLLRAVAYLQTTTGQNAGRSVLWMQAGGELNASADPVELPDPSDSGPSYWQARTLWAYGEGYAAFSRSDPAFAAFLGDRLRLSVAALNRDVLSRYGQYRFADGRRVPAWLITNGADATAEAVLGLNAYVAAAPGDRAARRALSQLANGIAAMATEQPDSWPYGAVLPWAESRTLWHAWGSQLSAALARSAAVLERPALLRPAVTEAVRFDTTMLTGGGADNGWLPVPIERVQIAYGVDSRVQSLLAVADVADRPVARELAGLQAAWFFGANRSGEPMYSPSTGVTFDGLEADGRINRNSGAESTIHGLLTMLALDAHPGVRARATALTTVAERDGLRVVEAEAADDTTGTVTRPESAWTGESSWSGGAYLALDPGDTAALTLPASDGRLVVEPVAWQQERGVARTTWSQAGREIGALRHRVGPQGITAVPGALLPQRLPALVEPAAGELRVTARRGEVRLDALLVRPVVSRIRLTGSGASTELVHSASTRAERTTVGAVGQRARLQLYDHRGRQLESRTVHGRVTVVLPSGGVAVLTR